VIIDLNWLIEMLNHKQVYTYENFQEMLKRTKIDRPKIPSGKNKTHH